MGDRDQHDCPSQIADDLAALRSASGTNLGSMDETMEAAARRPAPEGGWTMLVKKMKRRPRAMITLSSVAVVLALLLVPLPYRRVVGHGVQLRLGEAEGKEATKVAARVKRALGASRARLTRADGGFLLDAEVPERSRTTLERKLSALLGGLRQEGVRAELGEVRERSERATGSVYAMARELISLRVSVDGKTAEQIEAELRAQLAAASIDDADVRVTQEGDLTSIAIEHAGDEEAHPSIEVAVDAPDEADVRQIQIGVEGDGADMEAVAAEVRRKLAEKGVRDVEVTLENGRIAVKKKAP